MKPLSKRLKPIYFCTFNNIVWIFRRSILAQIVFVLIVYSIAFLFDRNTKIRCNKAYIFGQYLAKKTCSS